jgi:hypothetical protein
MSKYQYLQMLKQCADGKSELAWQGSHSSPGQRQGKPRTRVPLECVAFLLASCCCCCCTSDSVGMMGETCGVARVGNHSVHCSRVWPRGEDSIDIPPGMSCFIIITVKLSIHRLTCAGQTRPAGGIAQSCSDDVVPVVLLHSRRAWKANRMISKDKKQVNGLKH